MTFDQVQRLYQRRMKLLRDAAESSPRSLHEFNFAVAMKLNQLGGRDLLDADVALVKALAKYFDPDSPPTKETPNGNAGTPRRDDRRVD